MKYCCKCKDTKPFTEFYKHKNRQDGYGSYCKTCNTEWVRKRYKDNKDYYDNKNIEARKRNKEFVQEYLLSHPCVDCGESDPIVLEFDHIKGKKRQAISYMVQRMFSLESIEKEIDKCQVRCANCHRRRHYYESE